MEVQTRINRRALAGVAGTVSHWSVHNGWLLLLLFLLVALLWLSISVPPAGATSLKEPAGQVDQARASLTSSQPQTLTLTAQPSIIPANGLCFSTLTADVQDSLGDPADNGTVLVFSTTLGAFPGGLMVTPQPTGVMTIEAESGVVVTAGSWLSYPEPLASGAEVIYSCVPSDRITYEFTGTAISVIFQKQFNAGIAYVYLDGEFHGEIDTYWDDGSLAGKLTQQEEPVDSGLPYAPHLVEVEVTARKNVSATNVCVVVDAFRVYGHDRNGAYLTSGGTSTITLTSVITPGTAQVTTCAEPACDAATVLFGPNQPQTLTLTASPHSIVADGLSFSTLTADVQGPLGAAAEDGTVVVFSTTLGTFPGGLTITPEPTGVMTTEAEAALVGKVGGWTAYGDGSASGGGGVYADAVGAKLTYTFTGTAISVIFQKQFNAGIAHVYLDGLLYAEIDTYWDDGSGSGKLFQQEEPIASGLPYGPHLVEAVVTGTKHPDSDGAYLVVDAFRVAGHNRNGAYLTSSGVSTITLTSIVTPGTALVTACADPACASETVYFRKPWGGLIFVPIIFKDFSLPPIPDCDEALQNGGFEDGTAWVVGVTPRPARYSTTQAHSGSQSALLGLKPGESDVLSYSSVRQAITLPVNTDSATFSFWVFALSDLDAGDRQECLLLDQDDHLLAVLMQTNIHTAAWMEQSYDITAYAGETIQVYCNAYNDGDGSGVSGFYLDDASVQVCTSGEVPPEPPPSPPPPPPPVPEPPGCYPALLTTVGVGQTPHGAAVNSAAKRLYVANHGNDTLSVINSVTYGLVASPAVGDGPNGVAYNPANNKIYVANENSNSVTVLRATDYGVDKTIPVGLQPRGVAVNEVTNRVYVANYASGTVSIIDGATGTVIKTVAVGTEPAMVDVDPIINKAFVSLHGAGRVAVIDSAGNATQVDIFSAGPYGIAVDALRHLVYVATIDTFRIAVVDGLNNSFLGWAEIRRVPSDQPVPLRMIAVNPLIGPSGHIYVTTAGGDGGWNRVLMLPKGWPEHFARAHALDLNEPQEGIAFEPTTMRVFVPSRTDNLVAVYLDGEPSCPTNFGLLTDYQIVICVANPDGTCKQNLTK